MKTIDSLRPRLSEPDMNISDWQTGSPPHSPGLAAYFAFSTLTRAKRNEPNPHGLISETSTLKTAAHIWYTDAQKSAGEHAY